MRLSALMIVILMMTGIARTQTGTARAEGFCSPANTGSHNSFIINCGVGVEQGKKIIKLLNAVLANRDQASVISKLDELLTIANRPTQTTCSGNTDSNCVAGNNYSAQTVSDNRRYGVHIPPPNLIGVTATQLPPSIPPSRPKSISNIDWMVQLNAFRDTSPGTGEVRQVETPGVRLEFGVSKLFSNPAFLVRCSHQCFGTAVGVGTDMGMHFSGGLSSRNKMLGDSRDPRIALFEVGSEGAIAPGDQVVLIIRSVTSEPVSATVEAYVE